MKYKKLICKKLKTFATDCLCSTRSFHTSNIKLSKLSSLLRFPSPYYSYYYAHKISTRLLYFRKNLFLRKDDIIFKFYSNSSN